MPKARNISKEKSLQNQLRYNRGMSKKRLLADRVKQICTYLSFALASFVLLSIFYFVFSRGLSSLNLDLIRGSFHSEKYMVSLTDGSAKAFEFEAELPEGQYFSKKYGIVLEDGKDSSNAPLLLLRRVEEGSPLESSVNDIAGETKGQAQSIPLAVTFSRIAYEDLEGAEKSTGVVRKHDAAEVVRILDEESSAIKRINYESIGGGLRGSLIATLMLIGLTLVLALPVGVFAAIYIHEIAPKAKASRKMRQSIEMLNAVPSIIFGLMGMAVFFPITQAVGATTPNILLGALTMAVVLLPVIIRQTEEALATVPQSLRMGALALGATKTQTIFQVVLPNALSGILTAILLSVSRIIGESAALIYTMGTFVSDHPQVRGRATTLAVQIWSVMSGEQPNFALASAISIIVLAMVLILNISIKLLSKRLQKRA